MDTPPSAIEKRMRRASPSLPLTPLHQALLQAAVFGHSALPLQLGRYTLTHDLGGGATGRVYEAFDPIKQQRVAIKVLHGSGPDSELLLKREFRALLNISHPNLITYFGAQVTDGVCYLTMELVDGERFTSWVARGVPHRRDHSFGQTVRCDLDRLRSAARQLADGVVMLHAAGLVHRDLKPSNVLITGTSRLVVLDFGLSHNPQTLLHRVTASEHKGGTPAYMAPEQFDGAESPSPASDCYAIGLMLYEALVGKLPHVRDCRTEMASLRSSSAPVRASEIVAGVPPDLDELCHALLQPERSARPSCRDILSYLNDRRTIAPAAARSATTSPLPEPRRPPARLIGRTSELQALRAALAASSQRSIMLALGGAAGAGKTALVQSFISELSREHHVVLATNCHENEALPYKTLNALLEALVPFLKMLSPRALDGLLPRHTAELVTLFPSLARVRRLANVSLDGCSTDDRERTRRAIDALRELLGRIADRCTLVVWVDDLQWGDCDSVRLIRQLLWSRDAPRCLCVGTFRTDSPDVEVFVERFLGRRHRMEVPHEVRTHCLGPLSEADALALASSLLSESPREAVLQVARESSGNPSLVHQLAALALARSTDALARPVTLHELWYSRLLRLSPTATHVLRLIAIAASSIEQNVISSAARLTDNTVFHELRTARVVYSEGTRARVYLYDPRLAHAVLDALHPNTLRGLHSRLADALIACGGAEHERIAFHLQRAAREVEAVAWLMKGAERASALSSHGRAARLYALAAALPLDSERAHAIGVARAHALRAWGRHLDAGDAYLHAVASEPDHWQRLDLKAWAAHELLTAGEVQRGCSLVKQLLPAVGSRDSRIMRSVLATSLARQALVKGLRPRSLRRDDHENAKSVLARVNICWKLGHALLLTDPRRAAQVQRQHARLALKCGDPLRLARALALEAVCACHAGPNAREDVALLLRTARQLSGAIASQSLRATIALCDAAAACFTGEPERACIEADFAERIISAESTSTAHEIEVCHFIVLLAFNLQGAWGEFRSRIRRALEEADERGERCRCPILRAHSSLASLLAGDTLAAERESQAILQDQPGCDSDIQHLASVLAEARLRLYRGDGRAAAKLLEREWRRLERSKLLKAPLLLVELLAWRARAHALAYVQTRQWGHRRAALKYASQLARQNFVGATGHASMVRGTIAVADGARYAAIEQWHVAAAQYEHDHLSFFAVLARYQSARYDDGVGAARRAEQSHRILNRAGVADVDATLQLFSGAVAGVPPPL
jgi:serine/threonine protein kinase